MGTEKETPSNFLQAPEVKRYWAGFVVAMLISGVLMWGALIARYRLAIGDNAMGILLVSGMALCLVDTLWFSLFVRCPNCKARVFTFMNMVDNAMPLGKNRCCPKCGFPDHNRQENAFTAG